MAKYSNYQEMAKKLLKDNKYIVLATCDNDATPWANPVFYVYDDKYNFYFLSAIDSRHAKNIVENPKIGASIFNSQQRLGSSEGIQMEGTCAVVRRNELERVIKLYSDSLFPTSKIKGAERYDPKDYDEPAEFRFFKLTPTKVYITGIDRRDEVDLNE
jgi:uncharacterized protein YhbP (UPF0306 family)